jgi:hypothetical protein
VPAKSLDLNMRAFDLGYQAGLERKGVQQ